MSRIRRNRRGMSVLVVLLLLSLTMALSYAAVRTQSTTVRIQRNADRRGSAQQAAMTGLAMALKKMHTSAWTGVDTTLSGTLNSYDSYAVAYSTGDPMLVAGSANYSEYPYRVTLLATGYSADPDNPTNVATHQIRAVVRLVPRKLSAEPSDWPTVTQYTVYQWAWSDNFAITVPARIEGPVLTQAALGMSRELAWSDTARERYYSDLNAMRTAYGYDWRPYNAKVTLWNLVQYSDTLTILNTKLALATTNAWPNSLSWDLPGLLSSYQIYPGGKVYSVAQVASSLQNVNLQPDMTSNPLGIFYRSGSVDLLGNVTVSGTLVAQGSASGDVNVRGKTVRITAVNLPALYGTTQPVQLPAVIAGDDFYVFADADVSITGMLAANNNFNVASDNQADIGMTILGELVARNVWIHGRSEWNKSSSWWDTQYSSFDAQKGLANGIKYFPQYLQTKQGLDPTPRLTIKPATTAARYHWHNWNNPIFIPDPSDGGLRWELVGWKDSP